MEKERAEIAVVGSRSQIVIPHRLRKELAIIPKAQVIVYRRDDKLVVVKLKVPALGEELKELFREIDEDNKGKKSPTEEEILEEIQAYRFEKRAKKDA